jgi:hypothetical protein
VNLLTIRDFEDTKQQRAVTAFTVDRIKAGDQVYVNNGIAGALFCSSAVPFVFMGAKLAELD